MDSRPQLLHAPSLNRHHRDCLGSIVDSIAPAYSVDLLDLDLHVVSVQLTAVVQLYLIYTVDVAYTAVQLYY